MSCYLKMDGHGHVHVHVHLHVPGKTFLQNAVDVWDVTKDADYCTSLAKASILSAEEKYAL